MASVTGYSAAHMDAIAEACIVGGAVVLGDLILTRQDGTTFDAGSVASSATDSAVGGFIGTSGSASQLAVDARFTADDSAIAAAITALQAATLDSGWQDSSVGGTPTIITPVTAVATFTKSSFRRIGKVVCFTYTCVLAAAITVTSTTGNFADVTIGTLATGWGSASPQNQVIAGGTPLIVAYISGSNIQLAATAVNATLPSGTSLLLGGAYML